MDTADKIVGFRNQAKYYSKKGKRFRFLLETALGCFGSCPGCGFVADERRNHNTLINPENLPAMFDKMAQLVEFRPGYGGYGIGGEIETTVLNFGAGEHFLYDEKFLCALFENTNRFFEKIPTKRNVIAFSSSGLMNPDKMKDKAKKITDFLIADQIVVDFVIDLSRFDKLKPRYEKAFDFFIEQFGFVDLAVNIEKNSNERDWKAFCDFVDQKGVLNVDLVYAINAANVQRVAIEANDFFEVYEKICQLTKSGMDLFDINNFLRLGSTDDSLEVDFFETVKKASHNILSDAMFIDNNFNIYPAMFGIFADIALNHRFNRETVGNLFDQDIHLKWKKQEQVLMKELLQTKVKSPQCESCNFINSCYASGMPLLNKFLNEFNGQAVLNAQNCQNPIRPFLEAKSKSYLLPTLED